MKNCSCRRPKEKNLTSTSPFGKKNNGTVEGTQNLLAVLRDQQVEFSLSLDKKKCRDGRSKSIGYRPMGPKEDPYMKSISFIGFYRVLQGFGVFFLLLNKCLGRCVLATRWFLVF